MLGGWEFRCVQIKVLAAFWGPIRGKIRTILINLLPMNHWTEYIAI